MGEKGHLGEAQSGQALLVVILTMVIALTVGLSLASRSITNLRISTSQEESQKAFSAAEAGIEEALKSGLSIGSSVNPLSLPNNAQYFAQVTGVGGNEFIFPATATKDDAVQIWLSNYPDFTNPYTGSSLEIYWGDESESCTVNAAALEIIIFYGEILSPNVTRFAIDPCVRGSFSAPSIPVGGQVSGQTFKYGHKINLTSYQNLKFVRLIPLYKSTTLGIKGDVSLPPQGKEIEGTGKITSAGQEIVRKIKVFQGFPSPSDFFDYAIFSGTNL